MRNMLLSLKSFLAVILLVVLFQNTSHASHFVGADLTYECVGPNRYVITFNFYRDCNGIPVSNTQTINFSSASGCAPNFAWTLPQDTTYEVSQLCDAELPNSSCNSSSTGAYPGIEVYVFSDTVDFPATCSDWRLVWTSGTRSSAITNLNNPGGTSMTVDAFINTNYCSSSPVFTSRPTPYFCAGQLYNYNHGAFDSDGDTLIYEMITPYGAGVLNPVAFTAGITQDKPLLVDPLDPPAIPQDTFIFNTSTGQMTFRTKSGQNQQAVAGVRVYEIRNGDTIGYVMRDIQMVVINSINCTGPIGSTNPITLAGGSFDTVAQTFVVCSGETLIFTLDLADPDGDSIATDLTNTNLLQVFGAGNFRIDYYAYGTTTGAPVSSPDSVRMIITINAIPANLGNNYFTIGVTDNACPIPGSQILGYNVIIPGVEVQASDTTICPGLDHTIQLDAQSFTTTGGAVAGTYSWTILKGGPGVQLSSSTVKSPTVFVPAASAAGDTIILEVEYETQPDPNSATTCITTDQVMIFLDVFPIEVDLLASDTSLCPNNLPNVVDFTTNVSATSGSIDLISGTYSWGATPSGFLANLTNTNTPNPSTSVAGGYGDEIVYSVRYDYGLCSGEDSIKLKFDYAQMSIETDTTICPGDTIQLSATWNGGGPQSIGGCGLNPATCANTILNTVGAGVSGTTAGTPYFGGWEDRRIQYLFLASELTAAGVQPGIITELSFDVTSANGQTYNDFTLKMGCTALTDLGTQTDFVPGLVQVLNVPTPFAVTMGINTHVFDNSYEWDGVSNLIVEVCTNNGVWTSSDPVVSGNTAFTSVLYGFNDGMANTCPSAADFLASFGTFTTTTNRPNIEFGSCGAPDPNFQWSPTVAFVAGGGDTLGITEVAPQANTTYIANITEGGCTLWDSVTVEMLTAIPAPVITCGTPNNQASTVLFEWGMVTGATGWEVSTDSGATWVPQPLADSSTLVTGLTNGDCISILVRPLGGASPCGPNAAALFTCCTTPCPPPSQLTDTVDVSCFGGSDGSITLFVDGANGALGANPPYDVTLFDINGTQVQSPVSVPSSAVFSGLPIGTYYMTISDTLGCEGYSDTVELVEPTELVANNAGTTLTACYNTTDGSATVAATGGTPASTGYTYAWDANAASQSDPTADSLAQGTYSVVVTDSMGCMDTVTNIIVTGPYVQAPLVTLDTTNSSNCSGNGTANITQVQNLQGATTPNPADSSTLTYAWSNGLVDVISASGLAPGGYSVIVTDTMGCADTVNFAIGGGAVTTITGILSSNPTCGLNDGAATVSASGATSYSYLWSDGQLTASASGLGVGTYYVTVTGSNGCEAIDSVSLSIPNGPAITGFVTTNPSCFGTLGSVSVQVTGGNTPYTYAWSNTQTTQSITGLTSGLYTVVVTDFNNCTVTADTTLYSPSIAIDSIQVDNPTCGQTNGELTVVPLGGDTYTYLWSDGQTTQTATGLASGQYTVTMSAGPGCQAIDSATVNAAGLVISVVNREERVCNGANTGFIDISTVSNGGTVTYSWTGPNGYTANTEDIDSLNVGVYTLVATLQSATHTCTGSLTFEVYDDPMPLVIVAKDDQVCPGTATGTVDININNLGAADVPTYSWAGPNGYTASTEDLDSLAVGVYDVTATLQTGCTGSTSVEIFETTNPTVSIVEASPLDCSNNNAVLVVNGAGGTPGYTYVWDNSTTTNDRGPVTPGIYTATVTDSEGCTATTTYTVNPLIIPVLDAWIENSGQATATMLQDGTPLDIDAGANQQGVTYQWDPVTNIADPTSPSTTVAGPHPGTFEYTVVASTGICSESDTVVLIVDPVSFMGMPSAFTPNGDNKNDQFRPVDANNIDVRTFQVFNRWGQVMYNNPNDYSNGWNGEVNGKIQPRDVYLFIFEYKKPNDAEYTLIRGEVTLLR
ncbi:MAG: T9SS type B sorting domain-containing protein [Aureispira sp.]|nr:T9SS type B sorting domain-containing protein [Aureispira sp.]